MLLANFNLANTCVPHATPLCTFMRMITCIALVCLAEFSFGDLVKIRQFEGCPVLPSNVRE